MFVIVGLIIVSCNAGKCKNSINSQPFTFSINNLSLNSGESTTAIITYNENLSGELLATIGSTQPNVLSVSPQSCIFTSNVKTCQIILNGLSEGTAQINVIDSAGNKSTSNVITVKGNVTPPMAQFLITYVNLNYISNPSGSATTNYYFDGNSYSTVSNLQNMILAYYNVNGKPLYLAQSYPHYALQTNQASILYSNDGITWQNAINPCQTGEIPLYTIFNSTSNLLYLRCEDINSNTSSLWSTVNGYTFNLVNGIVQNDAFSRYINLGSTIVRVSLNGNTAEELSSGSWVPVSNWSNPNSITGDNMTSNGSNIVGAIGNDVYVSTDNGQTWTLTITGLSNAAVLYVQGSNSFIAYSINTPSKLQSSSDGVNWSTISNTSIGGSDTDISTLGLISYSSEYGYLILDPLLSGATLLNSSAATPAQFNSMSVQPPSDNYSPFFGLQYGIVTAAY